MLPFVQIFSFFYFGSYLTHGCFLQLKSAINVHIDFKFELANMMSDSRAVFQSRNNHNVHLIHLNITSEHSVWAVFHNDNIIASVMSYAISPIDIDIVASKPSWDVYFSNGKSRPDATIKIAMIDDEESECIYR